MIVSNHATEEVKTQILKDDLIKSYVNTHDEEEKQDENKIKTIKVDESNDQWEKKQTMLHEQLHKLTKAC